MRDHRKLEAFRLADELAISVYRSTESFPTTEQYGLTNQMRRCAVSVAANIVEGSARESEKEYLRFLGIAFGSVRELGYFVSLARRLGYLDEQAAENLEIDQNRTAGSLGALIQALRKQPHFHPLSEASPSKTVDVWSPQASSPKPQAL